MGNIRPSFIKTRALHLLEIYPDKFTDDFETNKHLVVEFTDVGDNKRMRNWIAGYITRYIQRRTCLLYTSPSPRDRTRSRMPSSA